MAKRVCLHVFHRMSAELDCEAYEYCCEGIGDGHFYGRKHTFTIHIACTDCGKHISSEQYTDLDSFVEAVRKTVR